MAFLAPQNTELDKKIKQYKGRVVQRGNVVKYDSGAYAVFVHRAGIFRVTHDSRESSVCDLHTPRMRRTRSDAVSADTQVKMEDTPKFLGLLLSHTDSSSTIPPRQIMVLQECCGTDIVRMVVHAPRPSVWTIYRWEERRTN